MKLKKYITFPNIILLLYFVATLTLAIIFSSLFTWLVFLSSLAGVLASQFNSRGKWFAFVFDIISWAIYIYLSLKEGYYGEIGLSVIAILISLVNIFEWSRHEKDNVVEIRSLRAKEIIASFAIMLIATFGYGVGLYFLKSNLPLLNALSTMSFLLALYFAYRRSNCQFFALLLYDTVCFSLWLVSAVNGELGSLILLVGAGVEIIFSIYGLYNWNKIKNSQKNFEKPLDSPPNWSDKV